MNTKVSQWGNSAGVRIPKKAIIDSKFNVDDEIEVIAIEGQIVLKKAKKVDFTKAFTPFLHTKGWKFDREEANERG